MNARKQSLFLTALAVAVLGVALSMVPVQQLGTITLFGCAVDIRPSTPLETTVKATTAYNSTTNTVNAEVQLWVPNGVALQAADYNGGNPVNLSQNSVSKVALSYNVAAGTMTMTVTSGGTTSPSVSLPSDGIFDQYSESINVTQTQLPPISETRLRIRLNFDTYGIESGFILRNA